MKLLSRIEAEQVKLPMRCNVFWQLLEGEDMQTMVADRQSFNTGVRPRRYWNQKGRETLHVKTCKAFATRLSRALEEKGYRSFLAGHYGMSRQWMPPEETREQAGNREENELRRYARDYLLSVAPSDFKGAIQLESSKEIHSFLVALLAYPTVFSYLNLYLFCTTKPFVVELNHHADVMLYSISRTYMPKL